jgi:hypothetical protein
MRLNSPCNTTALATKFQRHLLTSKIPRKKEKNKITKEIKERGQRAKRLKK